MEANEETYPGIQFGYDYVLPSYDWAVRRFDSVDGRIQSMHLLALSIFAGLSGIGRLVEETDLSSPWFILAACYFVVLLVWGIVARQSATVILIDPIRLYDGYSMDGDWDFKRKVLYWAGIHFHQNRAVVDRKWAHLNCLSVLLLLETVTLLFWLWKVKLPLYFFVGDFWDPFHSVPVFVSGGGGGGG